VGLVHHRPRGFHALAVVRHVVNRAHGIAVDEGRFLNVDDQQDRLAFDQLSGLTVGIGQGRRLLMNR